MATGLTARIRLVKCPRCHRLLPELPGIPVYKCGGCDAILVAKNRTNDSDNTGLASPNRDSVNLHSEDNQPSSSNHEAIIIPTHHENGETSDGDKAEEASISSSSHETIIPSSGECVVEDPYVEEQQDESRDSSSEQLVRKKFGERQTYATNNDESHASHVEPSGLPNEDHREEEFAYPENDESPCSRDALVEPDEYNISSLETTGDVSQEQLALIKSNECLKNAGSSDEFRVFGDEQPDFSNRSDSRIEFAGLDSIKTTEISSSSHQVVTIPFSGESVLDPNDGKDRNEDEDEDNHRKQPVQVSSIQHGKSTSTDDESREQSGSSHLVSFANELTNRENDKLSSGDTLEKDGINNDTKEIHSNLEISDIPSKIVVPLEERIEEHAETISRDFDHLIPVEVNHSIEPSCDLPGMIKSAYDGMDDQFLNHQIHSLTSICEATDVLAAVERSRADESLTNSNAVARDSETPIEASSYWKSSPHENNMQNRSALRREKYQSKLAFVERGCEGDYENGSVSSLMFDEHRDSRMHSSDNFLEHDEEKVRLLRMVYELEDELAKSCNLNRNGSRSVSTGSTQKETWIPIYQIPQEERWHDSEYSSYTRSSRPRTNYAGQHPLSRMSSAANQVNYYGMEHLPGESIPHSMQLIPPEHRLNRGARMVHIDHDYYIDHGSSCVSSPQHFLSTQLSARGIRLQSDHSAKHHLRPVAGGAPFLTCYYCLKLLQIPAEFLLMKRRCNRLKCGHCSKVLEFSLQSRTHIVPYVQSVAKPPPYVLNELDDYAPAIDKSGSRKIDDSIVLPRSSRQDMEKELSSKSSRNKANKLSSEVGKLSTKLNSPLHRLMGYSSPSQIFRGLNASRRRG